MSPLKAQKNLQKRKEEAEVSTQRQKHQEEREREEESGGGGECFRTAPVGMADGLIKKK